MNTPPDTLPPSLQRYFRRMADHLDQDVYFYGSVTRDDYIHGKSDIDVAIFADNEASVLSKLQHFLRVPRDAVHKIVWKLNGRMMYGHKVKIPELLTEVCVYNAEYQEYLLRDFRSPNENQSWFTYGVLYLLKFLHYRLSLLPKSVYIDTKNYLLNHVLDQKETVFYVLP